MMNATDIKNWMEANVPAPARKLVVAYAMQSAVLEEIKAQALKAGANPMVMEMAKNALPMFSSQLFGTDIQSK